MFVFVCFGLSKKSLWCGGYSFIIWQPQLSDARHLSKLKHLIALAILQISFFKGQWEHKSDHRQGVWFREIIEENLLHCVLHGVLSVPSKSAFLVVNKEIRMNGPYFDMWHKHRRVHSYGFTHTQMQGHRCSSSNTLILKQHGAHTNNFARGFFFRI